MQAGQADPLEFIEIYVFLDNVFGIYKRYLRLHKIEPGCIKVTLQFPPGMTQLIQDCIDQTSEVVKRYAKMQLELPTDVIEEPLISTQVPKNMSLSHVAEFTPDTKPLSLQVNSLSQSQIN